MNNLTDFIYRKSRFVKGSKKRDQTGNRITLVDTLALVRSRGKSLYRRSMGGGMEISITLSRSYLPGSNQLVIKTPLTCYNQNPGALLKGVRDAPKS